MDEREGRILSKTPLGFNLKISVFSLWLIVNVGCQNAKKYELPIGVDSSSLTTEVNHSDGAFSQDSLDLYISEIKKDCQLNFLGQLRLANNGLNEVRIPAGRRIRLDLVRGSSNYLASYQSTSIQMVAFQSLKDRDYKIIFKERKGSTQFSTLESHKGQKKWNSVRELDPDC